MKIALFGGSFDPVHREHVNFVRAAIRELSLDLVIVMPSRLAPHKRLGAQDSGFHRDSSCLYELCHCAPAARRIISSSSDWVICRFSASLTSDLTYCS